MELTANMMEFSFLVGAQAGEDMLFF